MLQRRRVNAGISSLCLTGAFSARILSAGRPQRIGYLGNLSFTAAQPREVFVAFQTEMTRRGWVAGRNVVYEFRFADGATERFPQLARDLVAANVDLIAAMTTDAARAAKAATATIPIVFIAAEPVEYGLVASLARPGANLTGMALMIDQLLGKRMQLLTQVIPGISRVAYLGMNERKSIEIARASAEVLKLQLLLADAQSADDIPRAVASASQADGWLVDEYPMFNANRGRIIELISAQRKPAVFSSVAWVRDGGLLGYSEDAVDTWRRAAGHVDRILRGAKPADLPVEESTRFVLSVNLQTARLLGIAIDKRLLLQANEVIE